jgi:hypothetical protein
VDHGQMAAPGVRLGQPRARRHVSQTQLSPRALPA